MNKKIWMNGMNEWINETWDEFSRTVLYVNKTGWCSVFSSPPNFFMVDELIVRPLWENIEEKEEEEEEEGKKTKKQIRRKNNKVREQEEAKKE